MPCWRWRRALLSAAELVGGEVLRKSRALLGRLAGVSQRCCPLSSRSVVSEVLRDAVRRRRAAAAYAGRAQVAGKLRGGLNMSLCCKYGLTMVKHYALVTVLITYFVETYHCVIYFYSMRWYLLFRLMILRGPAARNRPILLRATSKPPMRFRM